MCIRDSYWAGVASRYGYNGGIFRGRDDGVVVWGNTGGGQFGYSFGVFEPNPSGCASKQDVHVNDLGDALVANTVTPAVHGPLRPASASVG